MAALRTAIFPLSAKNRRGGHILSPPLPVRVLSEHEQTELYRCTAATAVTLLFKHTVQGSRRLQLTNGISAVLIQDIGDLASTPILTHASTLRRRDARP